MGDEFVPFQKAMQNKILGCRGGIGQGFLTMFGPKAHESAVALNLHSIIWTEGASMTELKCRRTEAVMAWVVACVRLKT